MTLIRPPGASRAAPPAPGDRRFVLNDDGAAVVIQRGGQHRAAAARPQHADGDPERLCTPLRGRPGPPLRGPRRQVFRTPDGLQTAWDGPGVSEATGERERNRLLTCANPRRARR